MGDRQLDAAAWRRLNHLFDAALSLPAADREAYVRAADADDAVRSELLSLLAAYAAEPEFLETPLYRLTEGFASAAGDAAEELAPGTVLGDFEIIREVGKGAFARVYKARQVSLERVVALKVTAARAEALTEREARNMAALSHDHIVPVFALTDEPGRRLRLVAMPFVEGPTLAKVISELRALPPEDRLGSSILAIVDATSGTGALTYSTTGARFRDRLERSNLVAAALSLGASLAEALAYAHARGVLHLDVKPANVLLDGYGRPMLSDFNVALRRGEDRTVLGGTAGYMSPEHMAALRDETASVDPRSDVYALGTVIRELLAGVAVPPVVEALLAKATAKQAEDRHADATALAAAFLGARELMATTERLPPAGAFVKRSLTRPITYILIAAVAPQFMGSVINIAYNSIRIAADLTTEQQELFKDLVVLYNLVVYPIAVLIVIKPLRRLRANASRSDILTLTADSLTRMRRESLGALRALLTATSIGWLPGALVFPMMLDSVTGNVSRVVYGHFVLSFVSSWLVALTYSYLFVAQLIIRGLYPRFFAAESPVNDCARRELRPQLTRLKWLQLAAGMIPLFGAAMIVYTGSPLGETQHQIFQVLVLTLIASGMIGYTLAMRVTDQIKRTIGTLTGEPTI
jgi:serine/threonine protein kinase